MAKKTGLDCILYRCATVLSDVNTPAAATWLEVECVTDVNVKGEAGEADVTTRGNDGWRSRLPTLKDGGLEITAKWDGDDEDLMAIRDAWEGRTAIALAAMDGAIATAGTQGLVGNFYITNFGRNEPLTEGVDCTITAVLYDEGDWYEVSGS